MMKKVKYIKVGECYFSNIKSVEQIDINSLGRYARIQLIYLQQNEWAYYTLSRRKINCMNIYLKLSNERINYIIDCWNNIKLNGE